MYMVKIVKGPPIITEWEALKPYDFYVSNFAMIQRLKRREKEAVEVNSRF